MAAPSRIKVNRLSTIAALKAKKTERLKAIEDDFKRAESEYLKSEKAYLRKLDLWALEVKSALRAAVKESPKALKDLCISSYRSNSICIPCPPPPALPLNKPDETFYTATAQTLAKRYDSAIQILEMGTDTEVTLSMADIGDLI